MSMWDAETNGTVCNHLFSLWKILLLHLKPTWSYNIKNSFSQRILCTLDPNTPIYGCKSKGLQYNALSFWRYESALSRDCMTCNLRCKGKLTGDVHSLHHLGFDQFKEFSTELLVCMQDLEMQSKHIFFFHHKLSQLFSTYISDEIIMSPDSCVSVI